MVNKRRSVMSPKATVLAEPDNARALLTREGMDGEPVAIRKSNPGAIAGGAARKKRGRQFLPRLREVLFDEELLRVWHASMLKALEDPKNALSYSRSLIRSMPSGALVGVEGESGNVHIGRQTIVLLPGGLDQLHGERLPAGKTIDIEFEDGKTEEEGERDD